MVALAASALGVAPTGCALPSHDGATHVRVLVAMPPSAKENYCAWYGDRAGDLLYFGQSAFWWAMRGKGGDPRADLDRAGPQPIGRFDLRSERLLASIEVGSGHSRSGVWDVLVAGHQLWYTTFFESAGRVDLETGEVERFPELGAGLNEWTPGSDGNVLVTRYGDGETRSGSVLRLDADAALLAQWSLPNPPGLRIAPKTPAWNPLRERLWLTSDALERGDDEVAGNPTYILDPVTGNWQRRDEPELQFAVFGARGVGYRAERQGRRLELVVMAPRGSARRILLDSDFPADFDFVQDIQIAQEGSVVVTRWSGRLHLLDPAGHVRHIQLPRLQEGGLYYSAVLRGNRVCATYCAGVRVVCADAG